MSHEGHTLSRDVPALTGRMRGKEAGKPMTKRLEVERAPTPLEEYAKHFDGL